MERKVRSTSVSYTLKAFRGHLLTMWEKQLITEEEYQEMLAIYKKAVQAWMKTDFGDEG